jgi:hypothetical protein
MDGRISTLLQILSTFQDAFPSNPVGTASAEEPHTESDDRNAKTQRATEVIVEQVKHEDMEAATATGQHVHSPPGDALPAANRDESNVDADMHLESKGTPVEEEPWHAPFLPPGQVTCQVYDPTGVLFFLIVSSFSCNLVSLALFYKTVRLSNAKLTRLAELVSPLLGQFSNYSPVAIKFLYLWSGFLKAFYI